MTRAASSSDNPAQIRGDINHGRTGDKRPGFDPAAAPLETDAEAGGAPLSAREVETARRAQSGTDHPEDAVSYNEATRNFDDGMRGGRSSFPITAAVVIALIIIALALILMA